MRLLPFFTAILGLAANVLAISTGQDRITSQTQHFEITVDRNKKDVLPEAAAWLENAYAIESKFYDFETKERTQVVLLDEEDYSNGFAYAANQWIVIYLPPIRFTLRGSTQWFANVSAHELAHILTLRKMGLTSRFYGIDAAISWGWKKREADGDAAWIPEDVPTWLAEGLAQYGSMHCGFDTVDSHREMILREAWRSNGLLPIKALETFSGDSRSREMVYNEGFHLVDFLYKTYGRDGMNTMMNAWDSKGYRGAFKTAFGATPSEVYARWRKHLNSRFRTNAEKTRPVSAFGPSYVIEDAPLYDPVSGNLYYLSSSANDAGETHLYLRDKNGGTSQIQRNVNPPMHLAADGSLLYPAVRIDLMTGARISDLYRYRNGQVERLTYGLRAVAAIATERGHVYAVLRQSGRTHIALLTNGHPSREFPAPEGTEFMDLAADGDSGLYVGVARGNNSDIMHLDLIDGELRPVLASTHNERDPFTRNGRLYFSSDPGGDYAIYSLSGDTIFRHSPPGPSAAFSPSTDGATLRFSTYAPQGFLLRSQPLDSGVALALLGSSSNASFPKPPAVNMGVGDYDRTHMQLLGWSANTGFAKTLHEDVTLQDRYGDSLHLMRENPCSQQAFLGGDATWSDPAQRNVLNATITGGQCLDRLTIPYVPSAQLVYVNSSLTPDLFLFGQYTGLQINAQDVTPDTLGLLSTFQLGAGAMFHLSDYLYDMLQFQIVEQKLDFKVHGVQKSSYEETVFGNTLGFTVADAGKDFINQGILGSASLLSYQKAKITMMSGELEIHANVARVLFLEARGSGEQPTQDLGPSSAVGTLAGDVRIPMGWTLGSTGYRGFFFESAFLHASYSSEWTNLYAQSSLSMSEPPLFNPNGSTLYARGENPLPTFTPSIPVSNLLELGLRLKTIAPSSQVVSWSLTWRGHPSYLEPDPAHGGRYGHLDRGYLSFSVSL